MLITPDGFKRRGNKRIIRPSDLTCGLSFRVAGPKVVAPPDLAAIYGANLGAWYDGASLVPNGITPTLADGWNDKTSNGNNLVYDAGFAIGKGTIDPSGGPGGLPSLFIPPGGETCYDMFANSTIMPTGPVTVGAYVQLTGVGSFGIVCLVGDPSGLGGYALGDVFGGGFPAMGFYADVYSAFDGGGNVLPAPGTTISIIGTWDGTDVIFYMNGVAVGVTTPFAGPLTYPGSTVIAIGNYGGWGPVTGHISEVFQANTATSPSMVTAVDNYFAFKYA